MVIWIVLFFLNHGGLVNLLTGVSVRTKSREWSTRLDLAEDNPFFLIIGGLVSFNEMVHGLNFYLGYYSV